MPTTPPTQNPRTVDPATPPQRIGHLDQPHRPHLQQLTTRTRPVAEPGAIYGPPRLEPVELRRKTRRICIKPIAAVTSQAYAPTASHVDPDSR